MTSPIATHERDDKPLDPAVERVRRKLVRFAVINLLILLLALAAVVGALVWRTGGRDVRPGPDGVIAQAPLSVPVGATALSHGIGADEISLLVRLPGGELAVLVFGRADGALLGRYPVSVQP